MGPALGRTRSGNSFRRTRGLELVADGFDFTEGPVWHPDGYLLFSDVPGDAIHCLVPGREPEPWVCPSGHANGLALIEPGGYSAASTCQRP